MGQIFEHLLLGKLSFQRSSSPLAVDELTSSDDRPFHYVGIVFEPQEDDYDGDGIVDDSDRCVSEPEDKDDRRHDGCPTMIATRFRLRRCVLNQAEDLNDFEDTDGCPDATVIMTKMDLSIDKTNVQTHLKIETVTEMTDALSPIMTWME